MYEGRPYAQPDEPLVDQGLQFDIGTLLSRRGILLGGAGLAAGGLAAYGALGTAGAADLDAQALSEIPEETAGPYPGDGTNGPDVLEQSGVVRSDIRSSFGTGSATAPGVLMHLELEVIDMANGNAPFTGAAVYVWHCDRAGGYSMYSSGLTGQNYLRGVQIADDDGYVRFTSIFPGCYTGRWPHVHFEVYPDESSIINAANKIATSQVALPEDVCDTVYAQSGYEASATALSRVSLESDMVFSDDGAVSQLATISGSVGSGITAYLAVGVDTTTAAGGGGGGTPGGPGGGR
ncbi:intradiol ring-cleavage dioxygenase [Glycomyces sp. NPDC047010]|uniref:intradiol ring-cleavage dioxygenase n=1 Tax=Glycomyces sp. NPDC047010 TaxID=3155023 RepID=UPI0033E03F68